MNAVDEIAILKAEVQWLREENALLTQVVDEMADLMADSSGVAGLHNNGSIAGWGWLRDNHWLEHLNAILKRRERRK